MKLLIILIFYGRSLLLINFKGKQFLFNEILEKRNLLFLANKFIEKKLLHSGNVKEHYQLFLRKKNRKLVKQPEIITYQPKTFENPNIVDIRSVIK